MSSLDLVTKFIISFLDSICNIYISIYLIKNINYYSFMSISTLSLSVNSIHSFRRTFKLSKVFMTWKQNFEIEGGLYLTIKFNPSISKNVQDNDLIKSPITGEILKENFATHRWVIHIKGH